MEEPYGGMNLAAEPSFSCDGGPEDRRARLEAWRASRMTSKGGNNKACAAAPPQKGLVCKEMSSSSVDGGGRRDSLKRKECPTPTVNIKGLHQLITSSFSTPARADDVPSKRARATPNDENRHGNIEAASSSKRTPALISVGGAKRGALASSSSTTLPVPMSASKAVPPGKPAPLRATKMAKGAAASSTSSKQEDPHTATWASIEKALKNKDAKAARHEIGVLETKFCSFR
jgi:hypothetical protein